MNENIIWYFAYGNNMNPLILEKRGIKPIKSTVARVPNMRIAFEMISVYRPGTGDATIRSLTKQETVPEIWGVLHWLLIDDLDNYLDYWEAVHLGHYRRKEIEAIVMNQTIVNAITYEALHLDSKLLPSKQYLTNIINGAKHFNLPIDYQFFLQTHPTC